ncbi:MAG: Flp pilus assembly protein CpaB [Rhodospirillaceae bacterium]|nr:Flp pilus assembly protein CpaB [Rhodospirillaceae bacterium]
MTMRTVLLILVALLFAGATAFFVRDRMVVAPATAPAPQVQAPPKVVKKVLVAKTDLPAGTLLKEEHLRWQSWPDESLDPAYVLEEGGDITKFYGAVVRRGIAAGQPVTEAQVAHPGDRGFLAAVLKPGMRAVSVPINATTGVANLVFPGDRVDVLFSEIIKPSPNAPEGSTDRHATETLLENVRVLALNQSLSTKEGEPISANVATLEVTPKQAEMLALVTQFGVLSLSLRSLATEDELPVVAEEGLAAVARSAEAAAAADTDAAAASAAAGPDAAGALHAATDEPRPWADDADPDRGSTYTMDTDVSRVLQLMSTMDAKKSDKRKVLVNHGSTAETVEFQ